MAIDAQRLITVFAGKHDPGKYNWSPFVNKLQARLRFASTSYDVKSCSLSQAPKGKIPYVGFSERSSGSGDISAVPSRYVGDTGFIIKQLVETQDLPNLNDNLSNVDLAQDLGLRALLEDKVYFMQMRDRWLSDDGFYKMRDEGPLATIPYPLRLVVGMIVYRKILQALHGQGVGRYSTDEVDILRNEAWAIISDFLSNSRNGTGANRPQWALGGEKPTELDATLFGFLSAVLTCPANSDSQKTVRSHPILLEYAGRIHDAYFPDFVKWDE
ncbi:MAG: hypothetical protein M1827_007160 [Pycnora praestabilis]|nr:MAG: hypothetical protein M1827_007160 [Pycnora praestabilis]